MRDNVKGVALTEVTFWIECCGDNKGRKKEYLITSQGKEVDKKEMERLKELVFIASGIVGGTT